MFIRQRCKNMQSRAVTIKLERAGWRENVVRQILVPCGECEYCRRQKQNEWSSRLYKHAIDFTKRNYRSKIFFTTLTISNEWFIKHAREFEPYHIHNFKDMKKAFSYPEMNTAFYGDLIKDSFLEDIQHTEVAKYIYRRYVKARLIDGLRAKTGVDLDGLEFYCCCEFGDRTERIHFHCIFYVKDFQKVKSYCYKHDIRPKKPWFVKGKNLPSGDRRLSTLEERYFESLLDLLWSDFDNKTKKRFPIGFTNVNQACAKSFRYITKYVCKLKEDKEVDKCPFHHQSFRLGMPEDEICSQLLQGLKYIEIQRSSKTYKFRINKYYVDKYARLLGIKNEISEDFIAKSRELVFEAETDLQQIFDCQIEDHNGNSIDVKNNDLVTIEYGHYELIDGLEPVKIRKKKTIDYICRKTQRLLWIIEDQITYLNDTPYVSEERSITKPCETY